MVSLAASLCSLAAIVAKQPRWLVEVDGGGGLQVQLE
jgi:hypothetical protein